MHLVPALLGMTNTPIGDKGKFPGVFVRHKGHRESSITSLTKHLEQIGQIQGLDTELDSPKSTPSEDFAISSCTSSGSVSHNCQGLIPIPNELSLEVGMTISDSEALSSTEGIETNQSDSVRLRRSKRKKSKDKAEENNALDPVRYKTKMCKNWQQSEKCPYGPRCLFAHGAKEMRSYSVNSTAITSACSSSSPERQFYTLGHFPTFMPVPFNSDAGNSTDEQEVDSRTPEKKPPSETSSTGQYTHSPYSSVTTCSAETPSVQADGGPVLPEPYFPQQRMYHPAPMFPQMPFLPECAMYYPQFPYHLAPQEMFPMPFYQPVR
jgi:hypothetical protein